MRGVAFIFPVPAWSEYSKHYGFGIKMPAGLLESQKLESPIFTPTTKADQGHDLPMTMPEVEAMVGKSLANEIRDASINIYNNAVEYANARGFIIPIPSSNSASITAD